MTISERIKYIRLNQPGGKLSREAFAQKLGMTSAMVQNIEEAETRLKGGISESTLKLICATFNVNPLWLSTGEGEIYRSLQPEERFKAFVEEHTPDESPYFKSLAVMAAKCWTDEQWAMFRDFVEDLKAHPDREAETKE